PRIGPEAALPQRVARVRGLDRVRRRAPRVPPHAAQWIRPLGRRSQLARKPGVSRPVARASALDVHYDARRTLPAAQPAHARARLRRLGHESEGIPLDESRPARGGHGALYVLLVAMLERERERGSDLGVAAAAVVGALFWGIHPLRVESVAWATERRGVLSG